MSDIKKEIREEVLNILKGLSVQIEKDCQAMYAHIGKHYGQSSDDWIKPHQQKADTLRQFGESIFNYGFKESLKDE